MEGHSEKVVSLIQLESGYIATGSYDSSIRIWDIDNGQCISYFYELGNVLCLLEFETNKILAGTSENNIGLWDLNNTQDSIFNFTQHQLWVNCLVKCDEQHFASASNDANIIIWNYKNRKLASILQGHTDCILTLIKLNNGLLCSGSADLTIKIWDWKKQCSLIELNILK